MVANFKNRRTGKDRKSHAPESTTPKGSAALSPLEVSALEYCEAVIHEHLQAFFEVGKALAQIQREKLYRAEFKTFEDYCKTRWGMGRFYAYRQIQGAVVAENLLTMVNTLPENERQVRPLVGVEPEIATEAWSEAVKKANGKKVTGKMVKEAVERVKAPKRAVAPVPQRESWQNLVEPLLREALEKVSEGDREAVEELLFKTQLNLQIGQNRSLVGI